MSTVNNIELLKWQQEMGADEALEETPINHLNAKEKPAPVATEAPPQKAKDAMPTALPNTSERANPTEAALRARTIADDAKSLENLKKEVESFEGIAIKKTATNTVFADGTAGADIMLIGEAPGANEDMEGIPFCGASGKLLDTMLATIGIKRDKNAYISNTLFWRPPGNRRPTPEELDICRPLVEKHIALNDPKLLILVGGTAAESLLQSKTSVSKLRKTPHNYTNPYLNKDIPTIVIFHPSYLLRSPSQKKLLWFDLLHIESFLKEQNITL
jgi:DNA polymerase